MSTPPRLQCAKCPWKKGVDPFDIPGGYSAAKHKALRDTIAEPGRFGASVRQMACHETAVGNELPCVGWLVNQLGPGQNIALRLRAIHGDIDTNVKTVGEQHERFEDTLPKCNKRKRVCPLQKKPDTTIQPMLMLRTCNADMTSPAAEANGFKWPSKGYVEATDWDPKPQCGYGLHGFLWGEGDGTLANWSPDAKWVVFEATTVVVLDGKAKSPNGNVVFCGDRFGATEYLRTHGGHGRAIIGATVTGGDRATVTGGYGAEIRIRYWDPKADRFRVAVGYIGEDGIEPNTAYVVADGKLSRKQ